MTPDLPPVPPGRWLPRLEAAKRLGITERTLQRRMKQGLVMTRHDEHNRVQVYVPDPPDTRHAPEHDTAMTATPDTLEVAVLHTLRDLATAQATIFAARQTEQEAIIRQQAEEIGALRAQLAALGAPWWRVLWQRLSGREP